MGRATAMAVVLFAIIFVITMIQLRLLRDDA
jgi:ABC-type sugar transport system permease subunit